MERKADKKENSEERTNKEPALIVVSSPSGGGKTTIVEHILKELPGLKRTVSYTTRQPRKGEQDGEAYNFITEDEFKEKIRHDEFLEWEENFGYYYGTSREQVERIISRGNDVILNIDVKGARNVKKYFPGSISVFIMPPSMEELIARLKNRNTEGDEQFTIRLRESEKEIASSEEYDYLIVNETLEKAVKDLKTIIEKERKNRETR